MQPSAAPMPVPLPLTPLIGRQHEIETLCGLLTQPEVRLVTLTGTGGVGKTRIAVHVARDPQAVAGFDDVAFVSLASLRDPDQAIPVIAQALGMQDPGDQSPVELLARALATRRHLLILDNLEHLLACVPQLARLLSECPRLTILATSREVLKARGEREVPVQPLPVPAQGDPSLLADIGKSAAITLLVQRAQAVMPDFALTAENVSTIVQICRRLDGLPLAIELAAARVKILPPKGLLGRLDQRLLLLTGGARDLPERHQTLRATLDWSHELLSEPEQHLFRSLSVFPAGWTIEAAEVVLGGLVDIDVLDGITSLLDKSLVVRADRADGAPRFLMLETVREFAAERLAASGKSDLLHQRLTDWGLTLFGPVPSTYFTTRDHAQFARVIPELDNLRAAVNWGIERYEPARYLAVHLGWHYTIRSLLRDAVVLAERTHEAAVDDPPQLRARILLLLGFIAFAQLRYDLGLRYAARGEVTIATAKLPRSGEFLLLRWMLSFINGSFADKEDLLDQAFDLLDPHDRAAATVHAYGYLADVLYRTGNVERAEAMATETLAVARARNDDWCMSITQLTLARIAGDRGDVTGALAGYAESAQRAWLFRDLRQAAWCIWASAMLLARNDMPVPAVTLLGVATTLHERRGGLAFNDGPASAGQTLKELQAQLPPETFDAALLAGRRMTAEEAIEFVASFDYLHPATPPGQQVTAPYDLTPREIEVLRLLTEGLSDREIADALSISERTAGNHVQHAMQKIGAPSRTAAAVFAVRHILD